MVLHSLNGAYSDGGSQVLWQDRERVIRRGWRLDDDGGRRAVLIMLPAADHPSRSSLDRLAHEYELKDELDGAWAARPLELVRDSGRTMLVLEDAGGEPLDRLIGAPMEVGRFLGLAIATTAAIGKLHQQGLVHRDIKPGNILITDATGEVRLTGFGIASRLARERQSPHPPETIAGTLAYMAPEQTGRMNRSIDSRSDLYALGVTFYQMLTGALPFTAADPMEWVHCHLAKRPVAPAERRKEIPGALSAVIMKLRAKRAEDRCQAADGLESDLRRCQIEWGAQRRIDDFPLGEHDTPDRLLIPEKLYGRRREVGILLAAFDRVVKGGPPELVLVSGYSGIGKSSVVNELQPVLVPPRGLFAAGKFDQYKRDIPYATLAQAFQSLIRPLLGESEAELRKWREALLEALGPNGQLIVDLVPELEVIIGQQPPLPELPPQRAQRRFQLVFRRFIGVFARPDHPLALFLDDLQWLDAATLDLVEDLLTQRDVQYLLLIGAYRDNEVDSTHPLTRKLDAIRAAGAWVQEFVLAPLAREELGRLIADAIRRDPGSVAELARLIYDKTGGNPFFAIQFLSTLAEEKLIAFDHRTGDWSWDPERIHAKGYTDNVVDLMVRKLSRLPAKTQTALTRLACLGSIASTTTLSLVQGTSEEDVHSDLWEALRQGFIERFDGSYKFIHDRIHEATYSLISKEPRPEEHLRIGRLLLQHTPAEKREESIFDIVNQLNRSAVLITSGQEREQLAALNLLAGKRAKASTAYAVALTYLVLGGELLADDRWHRCHELIFELELNRAECEFLTGDFRAAEKRLENMSTFSDGAVEEALVACLGVDLYSALARSDRAVEVALDYLRHRGIDWSPHPVDAEVRREYERIWSLIGPRTIEELVNLPSMADPESLAMVDVLTRLGPAAQFTDKNLHALASCKAINLSLEKGNCDSSCGAYVLVATIAGRDFGDYDAAIRFGQVGCELVEQRGLKRLLPATYCWFGGCVLTWAKHFRPCRDLLRRAFAVANEIGDLGYAVYSSSILISNLLSAGDPLAEVQREAELNFEFAQHARFGFMVDTSKAHLGLIRTLRGLTRTFGRFDYGDFDERVFERQLPSAAGQGLAACWWWIRKLQARFFAGDYAAALDAAAKAEKLLWAQPTEFARSEHGFFTALSHAACCDLDDEGNREQHLEAMAGRHRQFQILAESCPDNFAHRAALVGAEIARLDGRPLDAMDLYERAISAARANSFVHDEALAYELAARFYAARGLEEIACVYLGNARRGYVRWGADGKARQLDQLYPRLRQDERAPGPTGTIEAPVEQLDLATVVKVSQAVSGEMVLERSVDALMRLAIEHAGAERGLLLLSRGNDLRLEAEAITSNDRIIVRQRDESADAHPDSIVHYVMRSRDIVLLDDASAHPTYSSDSYVREHNARSILCLPLVNEAKVIGVLYLENNLAPHVFTPDRVTVLKVLASQAAISLENSRLYRDLADREGRIRRLWESNILGICTWNIDGAVVSANDEFLRMLQYDHDDVAAGRLNWAELTPPGWREGADRAVAALRATGSFQPFEKEYLRKDGSRVPVLIGGALFEESGKEGVAFVLDLTERKKAEDGLRRSEAWLSQAQRLSRTGNWVYDATTMHYVYWSDESYRIWGFDPQQGLPSREDMWQRIHPDDRDRVWQIVQEAVRGKKDFTAEFRILLPDGTVKYVEGTSHHFFSPQGTLSEVFTSTIDLTERKRTEHALRENEAKFRDYAETASDWLWEIGPDYEFTMLTENAFGSDPAHRIGTACWDHALDLETEPEKWRVVRETLDSRKPFRDFIYCSAGANGPMYVKASGKPVFDSDGQFRGYRGTGTDVTAIIRAQEALRESEGRFRDYAETASDWLWEMGPDYKLTLLTGNAFGSSPTARLGTAPWERALAGETETEQERAIRAALDSHEPFRDFVYLAAGRDGSPPMYVRASGKPVFDATGEFRGYRGSGPDVPAVMRAQEALRESARSL